MSKFARESLDRRMLYGFDLDEQRSLEFLAGYLLEVIRALEARVEALENP